MRKIIVMFLVAVNALLYAQQINIPRIEQMPNSPSPYVMRDWKAVAKGYDSLVFNFNLSGDYLPLGWMNSNTVNYTTHNSFGLDSYVGTNNNHSGEGINVLPAVVGASLVGIDKSNQAGTNWVLYCEEYFNKKNKENVYLNSPGSTSGSDWWYNTMPNIFFYQLYDMYRNTGDFSFQFTSVADRWLQAVKTMGGKATPWDWPNMDYRAWYLSTMTPNAQGVHEPEASGAIAWLLYNAYIETGNSSYRMGAEWAMEFLNLYYSNPSYELQLPYGVLTAARMNAELNTNCDLEKMMNWCFNVGPLRSWGSIIGSWGGYDVSGLIGEVSSNDYAFSMNGFEQVGALVPVARYDKRYARAIGKWVLNVANASRLFYPKCLQDYNQDSKEWSVKYDPNSYIAHEAIHKKGPGNISPYATGDAIAGGWANTNLSLYSSSHVGILGAVIDTTNIEKILKLDLLKTDYFHVKAYPTYLLYNPYNTEKAIVFNAGDGYHDIYNPVTNNYLAKNATGNIQLTIPSDAAIIAVITPANGILTNKQNKIYINDVIVDYKVNASYSDYPPRIKGISAGVNSAFPGDSLDVYCTAEIRTSDALSYKWECSNGALKGTGTVVNWKAPLQNGKYFVKCTVSDTKGSSTVDSAFIDVVDRPHSIPSINSVKAKPGKILPGAKCEVACTATDSGNSALTYYWNASAGVLTGSGAKVQWSAPNTKGNYYVSCKVQNAFGESVTDSVSISVREYSKTINRNPIAFYPFNGNANDESGNNNNGAVYGPVLVNDRKGNNYSAYSFNGTDAYINVTNNQALNFRDTIIINYWMNISELFQREAFPISHGSWENRWKISITNNKIRWTIKTDKGVKDLDSKTILEIGKYYNVAAYYDGSDMEIYVNGELDNFTSYSGRLNTTTYDLTIGQILPANKQYNFKGILDDIRIYDYALIPEEIAAIYTGTTSIGSQEQNSIPEKTMLFQNYPNPFNPSTVIKYQVAKNSNVTIKIFDVMGRDIATLVNDWKPAGEYSITFHPEKSNLASGIYFYKLQADNYSFVKKLILLH